MLDQRLVHDVLTAALSFGGDFAEIFVEDRIDNTIGMIEGKIERSLTGRTGGVGIRIFNGFNSVYTYSHKKDRDTLIKLAQNASKSLKGVAQNLNIDFVIESPSVIHPVMIPPQDVENQ